MEKTFEQFMDLNQRQGKVMIVGEEGAGKTLLTTYIGTEKMLRGKADCYKSYKMVDEYNRLGYHFSKNYEHLLCSNFDINTIGTAVPSLKTYFVDPYKIGLYCEDYETDLLPPLTMVMLTECHRIFNAYMWPYIRPEIRGYWETSRQADIEIILDTNQPNLVYNGMRDLCNRIIYLHEKTQPITDREGIVIGHKLFVKEFRKYKLYEKYMETNNSQLIKEEYTLILKRCVYKNYDTKQCRMLHLKGRQEQDYNMKHFPDIKSIEDVETFADNFGLYAKEGYYVKSSDLKQLKKDEEGKSAFKEEPKLYF